MANHFWRRWLNKLFKATRHSGPRKKAPKNTRVRLQLEQLEDRTMPSSVIISEVNPTGSSSSYAADWFEVTNTSSSAVDITGWKMDNNSNGSPPAAEVALRGLTSIAAGKSAIFLEGDAIGSTDAAIIANFSNAWFGSTTPPAGFLFGFYGGPDVQLNAAGDAVNLFNAAGVLQANVSFGASTTGKTFDNTTGLNNTSISQLSAAGVDGAFQSANGAETGSPGTTFTSVDLSRYVRVGRYDLPEPTRTTPPDSTSLLAQEASAVTYNWDTDTLFVAGDGGTSIVQVSKTGQLIDSMTLAPGGSPQGTEFFDTEGLTYVGDGKFVMTEERYRQVVLFTYVAGTTLTRADTQTVKLGTTIGNIGLEGVSYDPQTGGFILVKEKDPQSIFQTGIDFAAGTATNGSPTATGSTNLFDPALANLEDFSDVFALSNLPVLAGKADSSHLLVLSQESGQIVNIDRSGAVYSTLTIVSDPDNPLSVSGQTHEGVTMDRNGYLYVVSENGGGDSDHPQLWVYAPSTATNLAPTAVTLTNPITSIPDNTLTSPSLKVAGIIVKDDGLGNNYLSLAGADAGSFHITGTSLYLNDGITLNAALKSSYAVTVRVDDPAVGGTPDASANYTLTVTPPPAGSAAKLIISEVAAWSSGNTSVQNDWFEVTNIGTATADITGWTMDDNSDNANSAPLSGITQIKPNESVIFIEVQAGFTAAGVKNAFINLWFGGSAPAGLQIGTYTQGPAGGVGLSTSGDHVNLFNGPAGVVQAKVAFNSSDNVPPLQTFDNSAGQNNTTISTLSTVGANGAFSVFDTGLLDTGVPANAYFVGSPGTLGPPVVTIAATDATASEEPAGDTGKFRISRTGGTLAPLTVSYTISGQANSADYVPALTGVATIASGQSFVDITITPVDDYLIEGNETLTLALSDSGSYDVGTAKTATVTIVDHQAGVPAFLGVAAGDADASSVELWTRVDQQATVPVHAQVSTTADFSGTVLTFAGASDPTKDYTVKLVAGGLAADTTYYYRFVNDATGELSGTGTFKTAPAADAQVSLKFGFSGDMDGLMRPYALSSQVPAENLDFYVNLGDVIYETASNAAGNDGASYLNSPSVTLSGSSASLNGAPTAVGFATQQQLFDDYIKKYREQFLPVNTGGESGLADFYAGQANYTISDNHELGNRQYINGGAPAGGSVGGLTGADMPTGRGVDARGDVVGSNPNDAADVLGLASSQFMNHAEGYQTLQQVFLNYEPIRENRADPTLPSATISAPSDPRADGTKQLYFAQQWGTNAIYIETDTRSYRDIRLKTANGASDDAGPRADNPDRTDLGDTQLAWLEQQLLTAEQNGTPWKFVALSDPIDQIGPISQTSGLASLNTLTGVNSDGGKSYMGGYRAERNALLKFIADNNIQNVVFLATDDHQNRINEVLYSPTGDLSNQASYVKVPYVFSIVCGPLGATGPETITNHTFSNIKAIADDLATKQAAAGIEPIGLMGYSGLHDVKRDQNGVLVNEAVPQAVDFYSPDTFNFNILQVSADGKTLTVTSKGINSTAQNAAQEYDALGNPERTLFSFQIDAHNEVPVAQASSATTNEDTPKTFAVSDFKFSDLENNPLASITVTGLALASGDTLTVNQGSGAVAVTNGMTITAAQISTLTYSPAANANGLARSTFNFTVNDAGLGTVPATMTINVTAVNDAPVLTVPGTQTTEEDIAVKVTGIAVADVDVNEGTGLMKVTLTVASGKLTVPTNVAGGLTAVQISGNGSGAVVLQGAMTAINATLAAGVTYLGNINFNGTDSLTIVANDLGNTGTGGPLTDTKSVSIKVLSPTEQITLLRAMVEVLSAQPAPALNKGQSNSLLKELDSAQAKINGNQPKVAYNVIAEFKSDVLSLKAGGTLTAEEADPLLNAASLLMLSLKIGGGF